MSFDGESSFPIINGVKQGCVLTPTLFGIFFSMMLHYAFKESTDGILLTELNIDKYLSYACFKKSGKIG